jgi:phosphoenolpyruvate carboxykinase (GTP)
METLIENRAETKHPRLTAWVEEVAGLCKPDRVQWCDGSATEYEAMLQRMVFTGGAIRTAGDKRPNSILVRSSPGDVARVETALSSVPGRKRTPVLPTTGKIRQR